MGALRFDGDDLGLILGADAEGASAGFEFVDPTFVRCLLDDMFPPLLTGRLLFGRAGRFLLKAGEVFGLADGEYS